MIKLISELGKLFVEVPATYNGVPRPDLGIFNRDATPMEIQEAETRRKAIAEYAEKIRELSQACRALQDSCPHTVCYDTRGFPYDMRHCAGCDEDKGLI